jgi:small subunit ribosomal protein S6
VRRYENILIVAPDCTKEDEEDLFRRVQANIEKLGAELLKMDDWGVRKLAYPIKKKDRGHYFFMLLSMDESTVVTLDKFYRTMDLILRHLFVVVDERDKGLEKPPDQVVFDELEGEAQ